MQLCKSRHKKVKDNNYRVKIISLDMQLVVVMKQNVSHMGLCFYMVSGDTKTDITLRGFLLANTNTFHSTIKIIK